MLRRHGKPATAPELKNSPTKFYWHGEGRQVETKWMVKNMLPEVGVALMSGQWGMLKSFAMLDVSAALVTGTSFAGHMVKREGGVLIFAAEGAFTIDKRLEGLAQTGKLPPNSPIVGLTGARRCSRRPPSRSWNVSSRPPRSRCRITSACRW